MLVESNVYGSEDMLVKSNVYGSEDGENVDILDTEDSVFISGLVDAGTYDNEVVVREIRNDLVALYITSERVVIIASVVSVDEGRISGVNVVLNNCGGTDKTCVNIVTDG